MGRHAADVAPAIISAVTGTAIKGSSIIFGNRTPDVDVPRTNTPGNPNSPSGTNGNSNGGADNRPGGGNKPDADAKDNNNNRPPPTPKFDCLNNPLSCKDVNGIWAYWTNPITNKVEPIATAKIYDSKFRIENDHIIPKRKINAIASQHQHA
ncbi:hypothetical protein LPB140_00580 [Sphingorhabdus lutea]|uniref:Uncharacterized protein n=1 Tax=Sphingorhabdus lutea TaxID=1913578 RepID=A0A1L3J8Y3_9SPHN|nr:hypothetical protein [Sphingorhabdus lutea]APG61585.1 hypothetical protein LPB140_00580 [Sphingorhabdus lutea]